jgi:hypothetical protein
VQVALGLMQVDFRINPNHASNVGINPFNTPNAQEIWKVAAVPPFKAVAFEDVPKVDGWIRSKFTGVWAEDAALAKKLWDMWDEEFKQVWATRNGALTRPDAEWRFLIYFGLVK